MKNEIKKLFRLLGESSVDFSEYEGEMEEVAFDLASRDSYVAGIVDRIVEDMPPLKDRELVSLYAPIIVDEHYWLFREKKELISPLTRNFFNTQNVSKLFVRSAWRI
jgi:hypothetical protein